MFWNYFQSCKDNALSVPVVLILMMLKLLQMALTTVKN